MGKRYIQNKEGLKKKFLHKFNIVFLTHCTGPNLPKKLYGHAVIGLENDLLVLGGNSGFWYEKAIHRLSCANADCIWTTMKQALKVRRQYFVAIPIPDSLSGCINESK